MAQSEAIQMLFEMFDRRMIVPADDIRETFFSELTWDTFRRRLVCGELDLPVIIYRRSQKSGYFVDVRDLATWHDSYRRKAANDLTRLKVAS